MITFQFQFNMYFWIFAINLGKYKITNCNKKKDKLTRKFGKATGRKSSYKSLNEFVFCL